MPSALPAPGSSSKEFEGEADFVDLGHAAVALAVDDDDERGPIQITDFTPGNGRSAARALSRLIGR